VEPLPATFIADSVVVSTWTACSLAVIVTLAAKPGFLLFIRAVVVENFECHLVSILDLVTSVVVGLDDLYVLVRGQ